MEFFIDPVFYLESFLSGERSNSSTTKLQTQYTIINILT